MKKFYDTKKKKKNKQKQKKLKPFLLILYTESYCFTENHVVA